MVKATVPTPYRDEEHRLRDIESKLRELNDVLKRAQDFGYVIEGEVDAFPEKNRGFVKLRLTQPAKTHDL